MRRDDVVSAVGLPSVQAVFMVWARIAWKARHGWWVRWP